MTLGVRSGETPAVTVAVAITRPERFRALLRSLEGEVHSGDQILAFFEGVDEDIPGRVATSDGGYIDVVCIHHPSAQGLSTCRNLALDLALHRYLIYLDDDVMIECGLMNGYRQRFASNYQVAGGPLLLPEEYREWPTWIPRTYGSLIGVQMGEQKIWGGNFGIDRHFARRLGLRFNLALGRHESKLCSGEDTEFIQKMRDHQARVVFDPALIAYHYVCQSRFSLRYLMRRAYWQGRSEVLRDSALGGLRKEARRAMGDVSPKSPHTLLRLLAGTGLLGCVVVGIVHQVLILSLDKCGLATSEAENLNSTIGDL